jgi:uncharacterized membrane protein YqjE
MSSQSSGSIFSRIKGELETYIEARANLFQLETTEKISRFIGLMAVVIIAGTILILFLLCLSLMAGYFFAQQFDSYFYGFALVAGFYLLLFLILLIAGRKKLATFVTNKVLKALFNKTADNDD